MQLSEAVTRLSTAAVLSLRLEGGDGRLCEMWMSKNGFPTMQPLHGTQDDSLYRVVGTRRTNKGTGEPRFRRTPHKKRHTGPHREGTRPSRQTRPRAPPHGIPKGSARAGRAQRPRRRHSVWQRINALSARATLPQGQKTLAGHKRHLHARARRPAPRGATKKNGPTPTQPPALPR